MPDTPLVNVAQWKRGFPPGKYYPGMEQDYEVCFTPGGVVWHRRVLATPSPAPSEQATAKPEGR